MKKSAREFPRGLSMKHFPETLAGIDRLREEILFAIGTQKGERVMRRNYGTTIVKTAQDVLKSPDIRKAMIEAEVRSVLTEQPFGDYLVQRQPIVAAVTS